MTLQYISCTRLTKLNSIVNLFSITSFSIRIPAGRHSFQISHQVVFDVDKEVVKNEHRDNQFNCVLDILMRAFEWCLEKLKPLFHDAEGIFNDVPCAPKTLVQFCDNFLAPNI